MDFLPFSSPILWSCISICIVVPLSSSGCSEEPSRTILESPNKMEIRFDGERRAIKDEDRKLFRDILLIPLKRKSYVESLKREVAFDIVISNDSLQSRFLIFNDGVFQNDSGHQFKIDDADYARLTQLASKYRESTASHRS